MPSSRRFRDVPDQVADGLEQRGYATTGRDSRDTRQLNVTLTQQGRDYARAITAVIEELNREVAGRVGPAQLAAADAVLRTALFDDSARQRASRLPRPPGQPPAGSAILAVERGSSGTIETVNVTAETAHRPGQPRSERDAAFLGRFDARMRLPIIVSAILPLIIVPESGNWVGIVVGIVTWLVFLVDFVVQARHRERYGRTRLGRFDLFVVIATAPWFLLPGAHAGSFVVLLRLARLARLMLVSRGAHRLLDRLGRVAAVAGGVVVLSSLVAYYAEHPTNPEFATVGDALWWGIVTLTTVGYGDIVPITTTGRWAAVIIMITGIAVLGLLAGSLASFFRLNESQADDGPPAGQPAGAAATASDAALQALAAEVAALRRQVEALTHRLTGAPPDRTPGEPAPGEDAAATPLPKCPRS